MSINLEDLNTLISIVDEGSFRAAAQKLHKAQSSVSYSIKNLEKHYGIEIFDKAAGKNKLTNNGEFIYQKARQLLKLHGDLEEYCKLSSQGIERKIRIAITALCSKPLIMNVLKDFKARYPKTQIEFKFKTNEDPIKMILEDEYDLVLSPCYGYNDQIKRVDWQDIDFVPVASKLHPASTPDINTEDLKDMCHLVVGGKATLARKGSFSEIEHDANIWQLTDFEVKKQMLLDNMGWGFMPKNMIKDELSQGQLLQVKAKEAYVKKVQLICKNTNHKGEVFDYLWNLFLQAGEKNPQHLFVERNKIPSSVEAN